MQSYSPHHRGTSEAHKFITFYLFSVLLNKVFTFPLHTDLQLVCQFESLLTTVCALCFKYCSKNEQECIIRFKYTFNW